MSKSVQYDDGAKPTKGSATHGSIVDEDVQREILLFKGLYKVLDRCKRGQINKEVLHIQLLPLTNLLLHTIYSLKYNF